MNFGNPKSHKEFSIVVKGIC